jgi:hypothetical protein
MPLIYQHRIYRRDLELNRNCLYVFGDNALRVGMGGQAAEMRGEPNAVGVATKWKPTMEDDAFFSDTRLEEQIQLVKGDLLPVITRLRDGGVVIYPADGIGTGLSQLPQRSLRTHIFITQVMTHLGTL